MKTLYFDCFSGVSGDMLLGAFLDCGVDVEYLKEELAKLHVEGFHIEAEKTVKHGISGTSCHVILEQHEHTHRHLSDIRAILDASTLDQPVKDTAYAIFEKIARAEGRVHGISMNEVHFHEVGALDSIADIIGSAICFHALAPEQVYTSAVNVGKGTVKCAHGLIPVPAPATLAIAEGSTIPIYSAHADSETATPTGMAVLSTIAEYIPELPAMRIERIGYGFGERDFPMLNGLRLLVGDTL